MGVWGVGILPDVGREEEDNFKISSTLNLVLPCDEGDGMALEGSTAA